MKTLNTPSPYIDSLILSCQGYPHIKNNVEVKKLLSVFSEMCKLEEQGDDELRKIWINVERGEIEDFGDYQEYLENEEVSNNKEFEDLWKAYYPDEYKWYSFSVAKYNNEFFFYFDSILTFQFKPDEIQGEAYKFQTELADWLLLATKGTIREIQKNVDDYNNYIDTNLPFEKRRGRILRNDFWSVFPNFKEEFEKSITPKILQSLEKIKKQSELGINNYLPTITSGDFFRYCEIGYNANGYFIESKKKLTAREKYINMADGRNCGLTEINEASYTEFLEWYDTKKDCGGHPWEICRGGNSTHISLFVCRNANGWYLRLEGSSRARVIETIKMGFAFFDNNIPFILGNAEEIYRMACGLDYIGIVPETVVPIYCHGLFPASDKIIDFMNLETEKRDELIKKAYWYPLPELKFAE